MRTARTLALCALVAMAALPALAADEAATDPSRLVRNGVTVEFSAVPAGRVKALMEGELADVRFRITDAASGEPIRGSVPGAWLDMAQVIQGRGAEQKSCKDKISLYLKGAIGIRPMVDLNSYYVVLMNSDSSVAIVDPVVSMAGATSTLASVLLKGPGADWVASDRERQLYISMPRVGLVAVLDTESFKITNNIEAGKTPVRLALQPDGRYLWVGNNGADEASSGVTVIDAQTDKPVTFIATGAGHHEIAFSADSRQAYVSNRNAGTVTVIDVATLKAVKHIATGTQPLALAYSPLARALYVSDGKDGRVSVIADDKLEVGTRIALEAGIGPMRITPDGRFALVLNPQRDQVQVIDVATHERVQDIEISGEPFQLTYSKSFAYVRAMHSERVSMINLSSLGKGKQAMVQSFTAGAQAPGTAAATALADTVAVAAGEGTVMVVNPADGTTYYYMEGMNAPSSNYRVHGSTPRAVTVVDRSMKEVEPGVYSGRVRIPAAGTYDVAFMLQQPPILHCFSAQAAENPTIAKQFDPLKIEYQTTQRNYKVGETAVIRLRVSDPMTGVARTGLADLRAMYFLAPGRQRTEVATTEVGDGVYEARVKLEQAGGWYVYLGVPSMKIGYQQLPYFSLLAETKDALAKR